MSRLPCPWRGHDSGHGSQLNERSKRQDLKLVGLKGTGRGTEGDGSTGTLIDVGHLITDRLDEICSAAVIVIDHV